MDTDHGAALWLLNQGCFLKSRGKMYPLLEYARILHTYTHTHTSMHLHHSDSHCVTMTCLQVFLSQAVTVNSKLSFWLLYPKALILLSGKKLPLNGLAETPTHSLAPGPGRLKTRLSYIGGP